MRRHSGKECATPVLSITMSGPLLMCWRTSSSLSFSVVVLALMVNVAPNLRASSSRDSNMSMAIRVRAPSIRAFTR